MRQKLSTALPPLEVTLEELDAPRPRASKRRTRDVHRVPTLRDANPLRHDVAPLSDSRPQRDSMPTLPDIDPLRHDLPS
jgi:hypothetical protein